MSRESVGFYIYMGVTVVTLWDKTDATMGEQVSCIRVVDRVDRRVGGAGARYGGACFGDAWAAQIRTGLPPF